MKKILLGTTTLLGAAGLFAGTAMADTPKVTVGGFSDFQMGYVTSEDQDANLRHGAFRSDNEVIFRIDAKTDAGLGYGGGINLEADTTDDVDNQGANASRTFIYLDGAWGKVEAGSDLGVTNTMKVDASSIARATGGVDGDYTYFFNTSAIGGAQQVIATPDLILDYGVGTLGNEQSENLNKVSYYTPRFAGFQAGVSYLFDSTSRGQTVNRVISTGATDTTADSIILGALNYEGKFDAFTVKASATGEYGQAQNGVAAHDLATYAVGGQVGYLGFNVAGSYGSWGDSLRLKTAGDVDGTDYWTLGASYEYGPFGASVTYLQSTYEATATTENKFDNLSVGADYKLAPGLTPYAEVSFVSYDPSGAVNDNDATVIIAGTQLAF